MADGRRLVGSVGRMPIPEGNSLPSGNFFPRAPETVGFVYSGQRLGRSFGRFPGAPNRETGKPQRRNTIAEQGTPGTHRRTFSRIDTSAVWHAIAAIFAAFRPAVPSMTVVGPGLRNWYE